jgi:hypothetical protein
MIGMASLPVNRARCSPPGLAPRAPTRADLAHALEQIDLLIRPPGDLYFAELRAQNSKLRFMPTLLRAVAFGAAPAGQPVLDAVHHL